MTRTPKRRARFTARTIPYLTSYAGADGTLHYRWIPPRRARAAFASAKLGTDHAAAQTAAIELNRRLTAWEVDAKLPDTASVAPGRRIHCWDDLAHDFRTAINARLAAGTMSPKTHREYLTQMKWLSKWALDGTLPVRNITADLCQDLRDTLVLRASPWVAAARLRMLRQLLGHAVKPLRMMASNPMDGVPIPTPPARTKRIAIEAMESLAAHADGIDHANLATGILLGFFTTQREGDLLAATRISWRAIEDVASFDRIALAPDGGAPMGLRILQGKTKKWVTNFLPHDLTRRLTATIAARGDGWHGHLLEQDDWTGAPRQWPEWAFQRAFRNLVDKCATDARNRGDDWLADQLDGLQYRDLRRSGMCWLRDMGATIAQIAAISGHSITYTQKILDTYMPSDPRGAAAGIAGALRTRAAQQQQIGEQG
jgi:hypothetical protein